VQDAERTRLNSIRELFDRAEHFAQWRKRILDLRDADANAALPRLLNAFVELSTGAYASARAETQVALIGAAGNEMLKGMQRILQGEAFQEDRAAPRIEDRPTPRALIAAGGALFRKGDYEGARTELLKAAEASPREKDLAGALLRVYFALGDYARGARQAEALLAEQEIATKPAEEFKYYIESGYDSKDEFNKHLEALRKAAAEKVSAADEYLLLGVIQCARGQYRDAAHALGEWQGLNMDKEQNLAVRKLLEHARKNA
jgi:tetratricopeptide (TPR) repeat protein